MEAAVASGASWLSEDKRVEVHNIIEALGNLFYLIHVDVENPAVVRTYVAQAEERLRALQALVPESAAAPSHTKGPKVVPIATSFQAD